MDALKNMYTKITIQSLGGIATAIKLRKESIERYYKNPKICKRCGKVIDVGDLQVAQVRRKDFCDKVCAAKFTKNKKVKVDYCFGCGCKLMPTRNENGKLLHRKYCDECFKKNRFSLSPSLSPEQKLEPEKYAFENQTKGSLFSRRKNWQSASSSLRKNARIVYDKSGYPKKCNICGYDKHYEVSHKKPVASFPDEASVSDINHISNLIALCRNCHWEFDNGIIKFGAEVGFEPT